MKIPNMQLLAYREELQTSRFILYAHNQKLMFHFMPQKLKFKIVLVQYSLKGAVTLLRVETAYEGRTDFLGIRL